MKRNPFPERNLAKSVYIVDNSMRKVGGRADDQDGVAIYKSIYGFEVNFQGHGIDCNMLDFDSEVVSSFVECCMGCDRNNSTRKVVLNNF
jgi:hypothetical protein